LDHWAVLLLSLRDQGGVLGATFPTVSCLFAHCAEVGANPRCVASSVAPLAIVPWTRRLVSLVVFQIFVAFPFGTIVLVSQLFLPLLGVCALGLQSLKYLE
jgi:hypothetical protein